MLCKFQLCRRKNIQATRYQVKNKSTMQTFPFIQSKPVKCGIKVFSACDASNSYPLQTQIYNGKLIDRPRQVNINERTVLNLVSFYKGSARNITSDNFFTTMKLVLKYWIIVLNSWNMTLVDTIRKNKRFLSRNIQPTKKRPVYSINFACHCDTTVCLYVSKKKKSVLYANSEQMIFNMAAWSSG